MNKEVKEVLNRLNLFNLDIEKNIEDMYKRLYITFDDNEISYLLDYIKGLEKTQNNWNELKKYIEKIIVDSKAGSSQQYYYQQVYNFMQEIESGSNE